MNVFTPILATVALAAGAALWEPAAAGEDTGVIRLSEPVVVTDTHEVFGAPMPEAADAVTLAMLVAERQEFLGTEVLVRTEIVEVCQKKGCFFIARDGDAVARVTFKDYGFFIPTDAAGKTVTLKGVFAEQQLTPEQIEHQAEDLGGAPATVEPLQYTIVASAISIPRS